MEITKEAFDRAVDVLCRLLGYEAPIVMVDLEAKKTKFSLNTTKKAPDRTMPVDVKFPERLHTLAAARRWSAYQSKPAKTFKIEEAWRDIMHSPDIPEEAKVKLRAFDSKV